MPVSELVPEPDVEPVPLLAGTAALGGAATDANHVVDPVFGNVKASPSGAFSSSNHGSHDGVSAMVPSYVNSNLLVVFIASDAYGNALLNSFGGTPRFEMTKKPTYRIGFIQD